MTPGKFIVLEGGEGAGKSTQARLLALALEKQGIPVVTTREPGGTPNAEKIRALLLGTDGEEWNIRAEALLFAAARSDHVEKLVVPALASGKWVICDRFLDSSRAYQGGGGGVSDDNIMALHRIGSRGILPDLTLLIEVSPEEASRRTGLRDSGNSDRIGGREADYHARVVQTFRAIAAAEPGRFALIDGDGTVEQTHESILKALAPLLASRS